MVEIAEETQIAHNSGAREGRNRKAHRYLSDYVTGNEKEEDEVNMVEMISFDPTTFEEAEKVYSG